MARLILLTEPAFKDALAQVWAEPVARQFTVFVFVSMLAYSAQDLILEPFAGSVMGYTPGQSTSLSGVQHGGTLAGMLLAALAGRRLLGVSFGSLRSWMVWGCLASCLALAGLWMAGAGLNAQVASALARHLGTRGCCLPMVSPGVLT